MPPLERLTTIAGAARRSGRAYTVIMRAVEAKTLRSYQVADGPTLIDIDDLDHWVANARNVRWQKREPLA